MGVWLLKPGSLPLLMPRIITDLRAEEQCADPYVPGLPVRRKNAARVAVSNVVPLRAG